MPVGSPKPQTVASDKYQKKAGYMVKGFKIKRELAERFADACEKDGVNQTGQIRKMMELYIEEVEKKHSV